MHFPLRAGILSLPQSEYRLQAIEKRAAKDEAPF